MAHFAQLDANNIVLQVIVVNNEMLLDENQQENESIGIAFCKSLFGDNTIWVQTSYNNNFRKHYAAIGYSYDLQRNAFIAPRPEVGDDWYVDEELCVWRSPSIEAEQTAKQLAQEALMIGVTRV